MRYDILKTRKSRTSSGENKTGPGFTLAELLIVVAIVAVLSAVAIPIFTNQLEKSREATDLANVRSVYAVVMTAANTGDYSKVGVNDEYGIYLCVDLVQKKEGFLTPESSLHIGDVTPSDTAHWLNEPSEGGSCRVYYKDNEVFIDWSGTAAGASGTGSGDSGDSGDSGNTPDPEQTITGLSGGFGAWNGNGTARTTNKTSRYYYSRISTTETVELDPNSVYEVTTSFDSIEIDIGDRTIQIGYILYTESDGMVDVAKDYISGTTVKADSGWIDSLTQDSSQVSKYLFTDDTHVYLGVNFRVQETSTTDYNLTAEENEALCNAIMDAASKLTLTRKNTETVTPGWTSDDVTGGTTNGAKGTITASSSRLTTTTRIELQPDTTYILKMDSGSADIAFSVGIILAADSEVKEGTTYLDSGWKNSTGGALSYTFTTPSDTSYLTLNLRFTSNEALTEETKAVLMEILGSTTLLGFR